MFILFACDYTSGWAYTGDLSDKDAIGIFKLNERYNDSIERKRLKAEIKENKSLAEKYVTYFENVSKKRKLNSYEKRIFKFIKFWGKIK